MPGVVAPGCDRPPRFLLVDLPTNPPKSAHLSADFCTVPDFSMRSRLTLVAVLFGAAFWLTAPQPNTVAQEGSSSTCAASVGDLHAAVKQVYGFDRWKHPAKRPARRWVAGMAQCVPGGPAYVRHHRWLFNRHRAYRLVTPFRGFPDEGYWLKYLAVPRWVVEAETGNCNSPHMTGRQRGRCRWGDVNTSSGACGPYQELGHIPCDSPPLRHHQLAHSLPRGSWSVGY
jgi:hypothetical protein